MKIPFTGLEIRQADTYTDAIIEALASAATGRDRARGRVPSAASLAASVWARAFASASVTPDTPATRALTPMILETMGRELCLSGEAIFEVVVNGDVSLIPSCDWAITGGDSWTYKLTFAQPSTTVTRTVEADRVIHVRHGMTAAEPWKGRGLRENERQLLKVTALLELSLGDEMSMATGAIAALPSGDNVALQKDLNKLRGDLRLVESTGGNWDLGNAGSSRPIQDWAVKRLGPNPPETLQGLHESLSRQILAAAGVSTAILGGSDSAASREAFRQFLHSTLMPISNIVAHQLAEALDVPGLSFDFSSLFASDLSGRARAFGSMVKGGMDISKAAALAGLLVEE